MTVNRVFLSSTSKDLGEYREAACKAIGCLGDCHCVLVNNFGSVPLNPDKFCLTKVKECDLFIGIVGHLYGSCPQGSGQSYTEREYEAAVENGIPCLMFFAPYDFPIPANLIESDDKRKKQGAFRKRVSENCIRSEFTSEADLATKIIVSIYNLEWDHWRT